MGTSTSLRWLGGLAAATALLAAWWLPAAWYVPMPSVDPLPMPAIRGDTLMRALLIMDALALLGLALLRISLWPPRLPRTALPAVPAPPAAPGGLSFRGAVIGVAGVTALGLVLRALGAGGSLWLDEVAPRLFYGDASIRQVLVSYISANHHLLNTLLTNASVALLGEREWVVRLPAILFGVAGVPAVYWLARLAMTRWASLAASLLICTSYHHIFFSQNSRGYSASLFFTTVGTVCLVEALRTDAPRWWGGVILAGVGNVLSQLLSVFVLAAQGLVVVAALALVWRRGGDPLPLARRIAAVFAATGLILAHVYLPVAPQMAVVMQAVYSGASAGFQPLSLELLEEVIRGVAAGFGPALVLVALPVVVAGGIGFVTLARANWLVATLLVSPGLLLAVFLISRGMAVSPRFFLFFLVVAAVVGAQGLAVMIDTAVRHGAVAMRAGLALAVVAASLSATALPRYYRVPKQAFRDSLAYIESIRRPDDVVFVVYYAEAGFTYYGRARHIRFGEDYFIVRSAARFDELLRRYPDRRAILVTTFARALRLDLPDLDVRIERGWRVARVFPGTIGDGSIRVWLPASPLEP